MGILESDKEKTAFKTVDGLYEFNTITMGLTNAPSMFPSMMNTTFKGLEFCVIIYLDDILVFSRSEDDHIMDLELVLARLKLHGLIAKKSKCCCFKPSLKFLGHVVSAIGILHDPSKVAVVKEWAIPVNQTLLRGFLGLANYFRRFIHGYAGISSPLELITGKKGSKKNGPIEWSPDLNTAFENLKDALCSASCLALPDWNKTFQCVVDASATGVGGVLMQSRRPIAFLSKRLNQAEKNYSTSDREL